MKNVSKEPIHVIGMGEDLMLQPTLNECMDWPWTPVVEELPEGDFRLFVPALTDFEVFAATKAEVLADWRDMLRSHLEGYLKVGKVVPKPYFHLPEAPETSSGPGVSVVSLDGELGVLAIIEEPLAT